MTAVATANRYGEQVFEYGRGKLRIFQGREKGQTVYRVVARINYQEKLVETVPATRSWKQVLDALSVKWTRRAAEPKGPFMKNVRINSTSVEEWYGTEVDFEWADGFDFAEFQQSLWWQEQQARFEARCASTRRTYGYTFIDTTFDGDAERNFAALLANELLASEAYRSYQTRSPRVICQEYEDGPEREVSIPMWRAQDFNEFNLTGRGGWLSAADR